MAQVACPSCGNPTTVLGSSLSVTCGACGASFSPGGAPQAARPQIAPAPQVGQPPAYPVQSSQPYPVYPPPAPEPAKRRVPVWAILVLIFVPIVLLGGLIAWGVSSALGVPDHDEWVEYRSDAGGYTAKFPGEPLVTDQRESNMTIFTVERPVPGGTFAIAHFDLQRGTEFDLKAGLRAAADEPGSKLASTRTTQHQGISALVGEVEASSGPQRMMTLLVHRRVYLLVMEGHLEHWDFFVESFRIDKGVLDGSLAREQAKPAKPKPKPPPPIQPLKMQEVLDPYVYEQERIAGAFYARGGRAPYNWALDGVQKDWKQTPRDFVAPDNEPGTSCYIEGRSGPGEFTVNATVTDADGRKASGTMKVHVAKLPEEVFVLKLGATPDRTTKMPAVSGNTVSIYPGVHTSFTVWAECLIPGRHFGTGTFECKDEIRPPFGSAESGRQDFKFSGYWQEIGDFKFTVSAEVKMRDVEQTFTLSREFTLSVVTFPEETWPQTPGKLEIKNGFADVGREYTYKVASVKLSPPDFPFDYGDWQAIVKWTWDETQLPPGMKVTREDCEWMLVGTPTTAGNYVVDVKGTVTLKWISKTYEVAETVVIRVDDR